MSKLNKIIFKMQTEPANIKFNDLIYVCMILFGQPRQSSGSHVIFKTPWVGDPRINIQNSKGYAKAYQVKQVLAAINKLEYINE